MPTDLDEYFRALTAQRSVRAIAIAADLEPSTLRRQLAGESSLPVETVVAICRRFRLDFAEVFVAVGFITEDEARSFNQRLLLSDVADSEIAKEIVRRLDRGEADPALTEPIAAEVIQAVLDEDPESNVTYLGTVAAEDIPQGIAADKKPRKGTSTDHAE